MEYVPPDEAVSNPTVGNTYLYLICTSDWSVSFSPSSSLSVYRPNKQLRASQLPPNSPADHPSPHFCRPATQSRLFQSAAITNHNSKPEMSSLPTSQDACLEFRENGVDMLAQAEKKMLSMKPAFVSPEVDSTPRQQRLVLQK
ncbi:hypothetical protein T069G_00181 [Trichoderma breve]|uniref:Uncharacterized protein n=1 Tax=Trichoderma breve TaxID=2034170 RepID=A0A9W9EBG9_9HYPO|nr:hypothetical protein T069G_00181 [Trichoderma breve]KAJ4863651.1 hypothetical protein T069G_00181 [Trichoderma breve]